jgi:hypothetical protein
MERAQADGTATQAAVRGLGHWVFLALSLASVLGVLALGILTTPDARGHSTHEQLGLPACALMEFTGFPCPGCGVTTSLSHLAHGHWRAALAAQPIGVALALAAGFALLWSSLATVRGGDVWASFRKTWRPWMSWSLAAAMLAGWIYKIVDTYA